MHAHGLVFTLICNIKGRQYYKERRQGELSLEQLKRNEEEDQKKKRVVSATLENHAELLGFDFHRAQLIFIFFL